MAQPNSGRHPAQVQHDNGLDFALNEITAGAGAKQILYNALMASVNPGDEVILPAPYWTSYADMVLIAGGVPVVVPCTEAINGFRITPEQLEAAITPRTRWCSSTRPPTPAARPTALSSCARAEVVERHPQVWLLADDIYEHILYDGRAFATPAAVLPSLRDRTLTVNGVSKAYAMTGWRLGYGAGPAKAADRHGRGAEPGHVMSLVVHQSGSAVAALTGCKTVRERCCWPQDWRAIQQWWLHSTPHPACAAVRLRARSIPCQLRRRAGPHHAGRHCCCAPMPTSAPTCCASTMWRWCPVVYWGWHRSFRISYAASTADLQEACAHPARLPGPVLNF